MFLLGSDRFSRSCCSRLAVVAALVAVISVGGVLFAQQEGSDPAPRSIRIERPEKALQSPVEKVDEDVPAAAQGQGDPVDAVVDQPVEEAAVEAVVVSGPKDPTSYTWLVFLPAAVAILFAVFARQVVPALVIGVLVGAYMLVPCQAAGNAYAQMSYVVAGARLAAEHYVMGAAMDSDHMMIMMFTLIIGFTVGVIARNGGTAGMVKVIAGKTESPRRGALTAWFAGLVVFFDDYANTMIVGPTMAPIFDRVRVSRAKLAYIVDSTAAPVASLAIIGTWVGAEIGFIDDGLTQIAAAGTPGFLDGVSGMSAFLNSLAYRFYPILALVMVFLVSLTGRDFGPMRKSQNKCVSDASKPATQASALSQEVARSNEPVATWWLGLVPVGVLVVATMVILWISGSGAEKTVTAMNAVGADGSSTWDAMPLWEKGSVLIGNANSYLAIFYGAILSAFVAIVVTLIARTCAVREAIDAGLNGMSRMFPAIVVLILAWSISSVSTDLKLGDIAGAYLKDANFSLQLIPVAVFLASAVISFSTGTSWATMGILCPVTVSIVAGLASKEIAAGTMAGPEALTLFYQAVGSVLAGSIFGDHCSPISDTTVLSSIASGCPHEEHVWTQLPYALVTAVVAIAASEVVCEMYDQPWYVGIAAGTATLTLIVFAIGRKPKPRLDLNVVHVQPPSPIDMPM